MPYVGGCTVIVPEAHTIFPVNLAKLIESKKMTIWYSVPLAIIQLIQTNLLKELNYSSLRWVLFGGEPFDKKYLEQLFGYIPQAKFSNVYGPAEVNQCTYFNFGSDVSLQNPIPLGTAWPETNLKIDYTNSDETTGELLVSTSTQMKGYWNQQETTEASFVTIKDGTNIAKKYYKTGDLVKQDNDNNLVFLGRKDRQLKVRGYRVELNEIENALLTIDGLEEVAVYPIRQENGQNAIHSNVVVNDSSLSEHEIRKILVNKLPNQSIPSQIQIVKTIPRTGAGKVDYKSLVK